MIVLNDRFTLKRDAYNWILVEQYMGQDKDKKPKMQTRETYHPWPDRALRYMCEVQGQEVGSITELVRLYESAVELIRTEGEVTRALSSEVARLRADVRQKDKIIQSLRKAA